MSSRTPIQVPEELKQTIDDMKGTFRAKTHYEVLQELIRYYNANEIRKEQEKRHNEAERARLEARVIDLGVEGKAKLQELRDEMGFRTEADTVAYLQSHYETSPTISKETLELYKRLMRR